MGRSMRFILALCFATASPPSAAAQTAEELVADILYEMVDAPQLPDLTRRQLSGSPAIFETTSSHLVSRLTVSTADKCRFRSIMETTLSGNPDPSVVTLDYDFSIAVPPVTATSDTNARRQLLHVP